MAVVEATILKLFSEDQVETMLMRAYIRGNAKLSVELGREYARHDIESFTPINQKEE